jgi:hypothetical protein
MDHWLAQMKNNDNCDDYGACFEGAFTIVRKNELAPLFRAWLA